MFGHRHLPPAHAAADPRRGVTERTLLVWFFVAVAFVMLVTGAILLNRAVWAKRVEEKMGQLARAGHPVTAEDLQRRYDAAMPEVNAADLYAKAFAAVETRSGFEREWLPIIGDAELPAVGDPLPPEVEQEMKRFLEQNAEAIGFYLAASKVPDCAFPRRVDFGAGMIWEHVSSMREGARVLYLKAIYEAHQGNSAEASEAAAAIFRMGNHLRSEPYLIGALTRMAIVGIAHVPVQWVLHSPDLSEETLSALQEAIDEAHDEFILAAGMEGEIPFGIHSFGDLSEWFKPATDPVDYFKSGLWKFHAYTWLGQTNRDLYHYLEKTEEIFAMARGPVSERLAHDTSGSWDLEDPTWSEFMGGRWMTDRMTYNVGRLFQVEKNYLARVRAGLVGVAASRYRLRHGMYPLDLSQLVGEFLEPDQVIDPFMNAALEYALDEEGFTVTVEGEVVFRVRADEPTEPK